MPLCRSRQPGQRSGRVHVAQTASHVQKNVSLLESFTPKAVSFNFLEAPAAPLMSSQEEALGCRSHGPRVALSWAMLSPAWRYCRKWPHEICGKPDRKLEPTTAFFYISPYPSEAVLRQQGRTDKSKFSFNPFANDCEQWRCACEPRSKLFKGAFT